MPRTEHKRAPCPDGCGRLSTVGRRCRSCASRRQRGRRTGDPRLDGIPGFREHFLELQRRVEAGLPLFQGRRVGRASTRTGTGTKLRQTLGRPGE